MIIESVGGEGYRYARARLHNSSTADRRHLVCHGGGVTLVSSAEETAKDVFRTLADLEALRADDLPAPRHGFSTTGDPEEFRRLARRFLGPEVDEVFGNLARGPASVGMP